MNLRMFVDPKEAEGHPFELFLVGAVYAFVSVLLSPWLFPEYPSIVMIGITIAASTPIIYHILKFEMMKKHVKFVQEHRHAIIVFGSLFFGFVAGYLAGFLVMPGRESVFFAQTSTIAKLTGSFWNSSGSIILDNVRVLLFCVLLSVFFGTGAMFILAWNASVLATALGSFILTKLAAGGPLITAVGASLTKYLIHGIPEMVAYLIGGLAGGMVFYSVVTRNQTKKVLLEAAVLVILASFILVIASMIEVSVFPRIKI